MPRTRASGGTGFGPETTYGHRVGQDNAINPLANARVSGQCPGPAMGKHDRRNSMKMRRRKAQVKKKARSRRQAEAHRAPAVKKAAKKK